MKEVTISQYSTNIERNTLTYLREANDQPLKNCTDNKAMRGYH